jgi:hypothetical protein
MQQQQMGDLYKQTFCQQGPWCSSAAGSLGLRRHLRTLVVAAVALLLRVLLWCVLQLGRLALLPLAAMSVLAQQHVGLWWALLAHSGWVLGECLGCHGCVAMLLALPVLEHPGVMRAKSEIQGMSTNVSVRVVAHCVAACRCLHDVGLRTGVHYGQ